MKIHFIGIGGIGVSALAQHFAGNGHKISGSDLVYSEILEKLKKINVKLFIGKQKAENISRDIDLVIYSPAAQKDNPERKAAEKLGIKCQSYPEALGELTKEYFTIAVSGSHGKSTTTAMIALILIKAGLDPTVIIGTKLKEFNNSNYRKGKGKYFVIEACEHEESFLNYWPKISVITNIEREHLDYYKNLNNILKAFKEYISHLPKDGIAILNKDDKNCLKLKALKTKFYSFKQKESKTLKRILKVKGDHNIYNALAALTLARTLKISDKISFKALSNYKGSWRRFEIVKKTPLVVSDYAHHPTEIEASLKGAKETWPNKKILLVFQPHQHQRTFYLFKDFVKVFKKAPIDKCIITDIYDVAGREGKIKVDPKKLIAKIKREEVFYLQKKKIIPYLKKNFKNNYVLIIMGAGDIYKIADEFSTRE